MSQEQNTQQTMYDVTVSASLIVTDEQVQRTGNRFTLPDGGLSGTELKC